VCAWGYFACTLEARERAKKSHPFRWLCECLQTEDVVGFLMHCALFDGKFLDEHCDSSEDNFTGTSPEEAGFYLLKVLQNQG
jgi:hypothetical protein